MSKSTENYINIAKENYKNSKGNEKNVCLMNLSKYLWDKGYCQEEIDEIIETRIKVEA